MYCQAAGVSPPSQSDWAFYLALSLFRLLAILAGVQVRARQVSHHQPSERSCAQRAPHSLRGKLGGDARSSRTRAMGAWMGCMWPQGNASSKVAAELSSDAVLEALAQAALAVIARSSNDQQQQQQASGAAASGGAAASAAAPSPSPPLPPGDVLAPLPPRVADLLSRLRGFMDAHVLPAEAALEEHAMGPDRWTIHPLMEELKGKVSTATRCCARRAFHLVQPPLTP